MTYGGRLTGYRRAIGRVCDRFGTNRGLGAIGSGIRATLFCSTDNGLAMWSVRADSLGFRPWAMTFAPGDRQTVLCLRQAESGGARTRARHGSRLQLRGWVASTSGWRSQDSGRMRSGQQVTSLRPRAGRQLSQRAPTAG